MSVKVGLISDTHGLLRPQALDVLQGCDYLIHGGDIFHTAPRDPDLEDPQFEDLYPIGTLCEVSQAERQQGEQQNAQQEKRAAAHIGLPC